MGGRYVLGFSFWWPFITNFGKNYCPLTFVSWTQASIGLCFGFVNTDKFQSDLPMFQWPWLSVQWCWTVQFFQFDWIICNTISNATTVTVSNAQVWGPRQGHLVVVPAVSKPLQGASCQVHWHNEGKKIRCWTKDYYKRDGWVPRCTSLMSVQLVPVSTA